MRSCLADLFVNMKMKYGAQIWQGLLTAKNSFRHFFWSMGMRMQKSLSAKA